VPIELPPLRERPEDIPRLVQHFVHKYCDETGREDMKVDEHATLALQSNEWRGNIRELENCIERAVILAEDDTIEARHLLLAPGGLTVQAAQTRAVTLGGLSHASIDNGTTAPGVVKQTSSEPLPTMDEAMRVLAQQALSRTEGDEGAAAQLLDIDVEELKALLNSETAAPGNGDAPVNLPITDKTTAKRPAAKRR
jgi:DNA-binding NtrC family response regulator